MIATGSWGLEPPVQVGGLAGGAGDLRKGSACGGVAIRAEVAEIETGDLTDERDLVFDLGGLEVLGADERQSHPRGPDATEAMKDVLGRDGARHVRHDRAHEGFELLMGG